MMRNGFVYTGFKFIIDKLCYLNLVELFKRIGYRLNPDKDNRESEATYTRVATDIFIVLKWFFILFILCVGAKSLLLTIIVWYLIITNLFTYFFHHIWTDEALSNKNFSADRARRRFLNLLLAVAFSNTCFAYLYSLPYWKHFSWEAGTTSLNALWFSISNSLAANYDGIQPVTNFGYSITMIQLMITFIFVTIIISRSIPQTDN